METNGDSRESERPMWTDETQRVYWRLVRPMETHETKRDYWRLMRLMGDS